MNSSIYHIPVGSLLFTLIPVFAVITIHFRWQLSYQTVIYALLRMIAQLFLIGFGLVYIFESKSPFLISLILAFMLAISAWIAMRPLQKKDPRIYLKSLGALATGCLFTILVVVAAVLRLKPWFEPRYFIPVASMICANAMNAVSLAAERFQSEIERGTVYNAARNHAFNASLLPNLNALFAVGLVSLPGMMTGQILAGISPLIAVRYQMMVMGMLLGSSGISAAVYLTWMKNGRGS